MTRFNTRDGLAWTVACILVSGGFARALAEEGDWISLFDGKTLNGWHQVGDGEWIVEDGAIVGKTQEAAKLYGLLVSDDVYRDFTVRLKFKSLKGNSGFYIHMVRRSARQGPRASDRGRSAQQFGRNLRKLSPRPGFLNRRRPRWPTTSNSTIGTISRLPPTAAT